MRRGWSIRHRAGRGASGEDVVPGIGRLDQNLVWAAQQLGQLFIAGQLPGTTEAEIGTRRRPR
jgi:hypothetical protein